MGLNSQLRITSETPIPMETVLSLVEIGPVALENNISKSCQSVFTIWLSSHFGKGHGPQFEFLSSKDARFG